MKNRILNGVLFLVSFGLALELLGFYSAELSPQLYDQSHRAAYGKHATQKQLDSFRDKVYSPLTGWTATKEFTHSANDCQGRRAYTSDKYGVRTYKDYDRTKAQILLAGDSYTFGMELNNDATFGAHVFKRTGLATANLGVGGFDPVQSFLRAKEQLSEFPQAKAVMLVIMYENINRMMNSYRPIYDMGSKIIFGFKPYMKSGDIRLLDPKIYDSLAAFHQAVNVASRNDYWAKPQHEFPYSLALLRAIASPAFVSEAIAAALRPLNREFYWQYHNPTMGENLLGLMKIFASWAESEQLKPIVLFIPRNYHDTTSPQGWIDRYRDALPDNLVVKNLDFSGIDPQKYNGKPDGNCHPSEYAAREIARQIAVLLEESLPEFKH